MSRWSERVLIFGLGAAAIHLFVIAVDVLILRRSPLYPHQEA